MSSAPAKTLSITSGPDATPDEGEAADAVLRD